MQNFESFHELRVFLFKKLILIIIKVRLVGYSIVQFQKVVSHFVWLTDRSHEPFWGSELRPLEIVR